MIRGRTISVRLVMPEAEDRECVFFLPPHPALQQDGEALHFNLDPGRHLYLATKKNHDFSKPPKDGVLALAPARRYVLDADLSVSGDLEVSFWFIEYDAKRRLGSWRQAVSDGVHRTWWSDPRHVTCCLALRVSGSGVLRLQEIVVQSEPEASLFPLAESTVDRYDPTRDSLDLELFIELNEEYESKPLVPKPRSYERADLSARGKRQALNLYKTFDLQGKRVLEIGCGRGEVVEALSRLTGNEVVGVDIQPYAHWDEFEGPDLSLVEIDITREDYRHLGTFDFIFSLAVWEHIRNPYSALDAAYGLLEPAGQLYLSANLYRGPKASHRYREVFFPWPHLIFPDEVFIDFYRTLDRPPPWIPAWVNKLTAAQYLLYFEIIGFEVERVSYAKTPIDERFYERFEDILSRYPRFDLERDFIRAVLRKP